MSRLYFCIYCYMAVSYRAIPDIMIAFSAPLESTTVVRQDFADFFSYSAITISSFRVVLTEMSVKQAGD